MVGENAADPRVRTSAGTLLISISLPATQPWGLKRGVLVYPMQGSVDGISGDHLLIAPPAVITPEQISWSVEQLHQAIVESL